MSSLAATNAFTGHSEALRRCLVLLERIKLPEAQRPLPTELADEYRDLAPQLFLADHSGTTLIAFTRAVLRAQGNKPPSVAERAVLVSLIASLQGVRAAGAPPSLIDDVLDAHLEDIKQARRITTGVPENLDALLAADPSAELVRDFYRAVARCEGELIDESAQNLAAHIQPKLTSGAALDRAVPCVYAALKGLLAARAQGEVLSTVLAVQVAALSAGFDLDRLMLEVGASGEPVDSMRSRFVQLLGMRLEEAGEGRAVISMPITENHLNFFGTGHGGATASLLDTAMGRALMSLLPPGSFFASERIEVNFPATVKIARGPLRAEAKVTSLEGRVAIIEARAVDASGTCCGVSKGIFHIREPVG
jgi:uncharacterized protein (TIGR00369 family)